ncbi:MULTISPECIES: hypothetical protein [Arcobacteraceae]|uniref:hypothetical protein n=1 Tax=Arcobacteraceae TaxID=2808963 RepID=UPI000DEACAAF|nr:hypothetical protein [Arcobacter sp. CECT 9188]RBQ27783.1 hypothetical protein CRU88_03690 [Arcobacter sp. CECT 9188]
MEHLKCKACGSTNTNVYKAKDLAEKTGDKNFVNPTMLGGTLAFSGADLLKFIKDLASLLPFIKSVFDFFTEKKKKDGAEEENNRSVFLCIDCGHWEKI